MKKIRNHIEKGCGIDIDSQLLWATLFISGKRGDTEWDTRSFANSVSGVMELIRWLNENDVTHVAFESTGVYWQILYNLLEDDFNVLVANPYQIKQLRGKKTDVKDSEHIATLLRMGVIKPGFVPPRNIRELRDLCRQYQNMTEDMVRVKNRITKTLRQAGITIDIYITDLFGKSGKAILTALANGEPAVNAAQNAKGKLRKKIPLLIEAVRYPITVHYRRILARYMHELEYLESELTIIDAEIDKMVEPFRKQIELLMTIPGFGRKVSRGIISEIGVDMTAFPSNGELCSWAKVCPGNNRSGGKRRSGRNSKANRYIRAYLGEAAWAAVRTKGSSFRHLYLRRAARLGKKKAIMSIMHKMLRITHTMLLHELSYSRVYELQKGIDPHRTSVRSTLKRFTNEDLVCELLSRGAKNIEWNWEAEPVHLAI